MIFKNGNKITKIFKGSTPITKVYKGAQLVWQLIREFIQFNLADYTARVNNDFGYVENGTALNAEYLKPIEDPTFEETIAIYNPNGGYRTGNIYDVRNTVTTKNEFNSTTPSSLSQGSFVRNSTSMPYELNRAIVTSTDAGSNYQQNRILQYLSKDEPFNVSAYVKSSATSNFTIGIDNCFIEFDISNGTVVSETGTSSGTVDSKLIEDKGNGWYRCSVGYTPNGTIKQDLRYTFNGLSDGGLVEFGGRQYTLGSNELLPFAGDSNRDLTVTGGGGTRFLADGSLENIIYNRLNASNYDASTNNWLLSNATLSSVKTKLSAVNNLFTLTTTSGYLSMDFPVVNGEDINISIFIKKGNTNFANLTFASTESAADSYWVYRVDLVNKTIVKNEALAGKTALNTFNPVLEEAGDEGYLRFSADLTVENPEEHRIILRGVDDAEGTASVGNTLIFGGGQVTSGFGVKPLQIKNNTAAFPKIDYSTGQPAFLIEPQKTNQINYSEDFTNSYWEDTGLLIEQSTIPVPNFTGKFFDRLTEDTSSSYHRVILTNNKIVGTEGLNSSFSFWIKFEDLSRSINVFAIGTGARGGANMATIASDGTITLNNTLEPTNPLSCETISLGNNCFYVKVSQLVTSSGAVFPGIEMYNGGRQYVGNGSSSVLVFGAQAIAGDFTSYIPTNGSSVTRTINKYVGTASPITKGSGYLYIHVDKTAKGHIGLNGANSDHLVSFSFRNGENDMRVYFKQVNNTLSTLHTIPSDSDTKALIKYTLSTGGSYDVRLFINGSLVESRVDTFPNGGEIINITNLNSFLVGFSNTEFSGRVYEIKHSAEGITDQEAIDLTTL